MPAVKSQPANGDQQNGIPEVAEAPGRKSPPALALVNKKAARAQTAGSLAKVATVRAIKDGFALGFPPECLLLPLRDTQGGWGATHAALPIADQAASSAEFPMG